MEDGESIPAWRKIVEIDGIDQTGAEKTGVTKKSQAANPGSKFLI